MNSKSFLLTTCLVAGVAGLPRLHAQASIQAAGGVASGTGGTATYSVGQLTTVVATGPGGTSSPGVLQPFEIFVLSAAAPAAVGLNCSAYPNPTAGAVTLRIDEPKVRGFAWRLADLTGRKLAGAAVATGATAISLAELPAGSYLLFVEQKNNPIKTFKIIKH